MYNQATVTARQYADRVIKPVVIPFMSTIQNFIFQQDNARVHTSAIARQALKGIQTMDWPDRFPALSLAELEHV